MHLGRFHITGIEMVDSDRIVHSEEEKKREHMSEAGGCPNLTGLLSQEFFCSQRLKK